MPLSLLDCEVVICDMELHHNYICEYLDKKSGIGLVFKYFTMYLSCNNDNRKLYKYLAEYQRLRSRTR